MGDNRRFDRSKIECHWKDLIRLIFILQIFCRSTAQAQQCPILSLPEYGFFRSGSCQHDLGALCGIGCFPGYRFIHGDTFRQCQENGTWSGEDGQCQAIDCSPLKTHSHVLHQCISRGNRNIAKWQFGTNCQARCDENNYRLIGPPNRLCLITGQWTGYDQYCVYDANFTTRESTTVTTITTTFQMIRDYSNQLLSVNPTDSGIILEKLQVSSLSISFWLKLRNGSKGHLVTLSDFDHQLKLLVDENKLIIFDSSRNETFRTSIEMSSFQWIHFIWIYSTNPNSQFVFYLNGFRYSSMENFNRIEVKSIDFAHLKIRIDRFEIDIVLFSEIFDGWITRLNFWSEILSEQELLVSYRDCRKQRGNLFSWSNVSLSIVIDRNKLENSSFCLGCSQPATISNGISRIFDYSIGSSVEYQCHFAHEMIGMSRSFCMVSSQWFPSPPQCRYNPCDLDCDVCDEKKGICRQRRSYEETKDECDPSCDDDEICLDGKCFWSNKTPTKSPSSCSTRCHLDQVCIEDQCACAKRFSDPICSRDRLCYEICQIGEQCYNYSCSCGIRGKCRSNEICQLDQCQCLSPPCRRDRQSSENFISSIFCPFPCLNGGRCVGFYRCQCLSDWTGHRCEQRRNSSSFNHADEKQFSE